MTAPFKPGDRVTRNTRHGVHYTVQDAVAGAITLQETSGMYDAHDFELVPPAVSASAVIRELMAPVRAAVESASASYAQMHGSSTGTRLSVMQEVLDAVETWEATR